MCFQLFFALDRIKALAPQHPEGKDKEPFASLLRGDVKAALAGGEHALAEIVMATHAGLTTEEFEKVLTDWISTAKHPKAGKLDKGLDEAKAKGWTVVDMKEDWTRIFPAGKD